MTITEQSFIQHIGIQFTQIKLLTVNHGSGMNRSINLIGGAISTI